MLLATALLTAHAGPAAPASEADVRRHLEALLAPDADARIAAANALARTPPALVQHLQRTAVPCTDVVDDDTRPIEGRCERLNHALYHFIRVVGALAEDSVDPGTELGAACLARRDGPDRCALVSELRWMHSNPFETVFLSGTGDRGPELPLELREDALLASVRQAYTDALSPELTDEATLQRHRPLSATAGDTTFYVLPLCGGRASMSERCAYHLAVAAPGRFAHTAVLPPTSLGAPDPAGPYPNLPMTARQEVRVLDGGRYGVFVTDGGCCDDRTRRYHVYDLTGAPALHCTIETPMDDGRAADPRVTASSCTLP